MLKLTLFHLVGLLKIWKSSCYTSVEGKPGFKISLTRAGDRLYAITAHYSVPGWSVIDVTDAKNPKVVKFIPGPENTNTVQVDIA
jgi:hypothetical protein